MPNRRQPPFPEHHITSTGMRILRDMEMERPIVTNYPRRSPEASTRVKVLIRFNLRKLHRHTYFQIIDQSPRLFHDEFCARLENETIGVRSESYPDLQYPIIFLQNCHSNSSRSQRLVITSSNRRWKVPNILRAIFLACVDEARKGNIE